MDHYSACGTMQTFFQNLIENLKEMFIFATDINYINIMFLEVFRIINMKDLKNFWGNAKIMLGDFLIASKSVPHFSMDHLFYKL